MPYSVSIPITLVMAIRPPSVAAGAATRTPRALRLAAPAASFLVSLQVLAGVDLLDGAPEVLGAAAHERAHVHDTLALLARDSSPVVRVGGVGQVLVLLELV